MHWGVDSARTANSMARDRVTATFDAVQHRAGVAPQFWGRYIGGKYKIASSEAAFLHTRGCKVLLAYNGTSNTAGSVQGGLAEGQHDASKAIADASALQVSAGTAIYADIEGNWGPTANWLRGWATAIVAAHFKVGFYCRPSPENVFTHVYRVAAAAEPSVASAFLWASHPQPNPQCRAAASAPPFAPFVPTGGGNSFLWQYSDNCWTDLLGETAGIDMDLATDAAFAAMW